MNLVFVTWTISFRVSLVDETKCVVLICAQIVRRQRIFAVGEVSGNASSWISGTMLKN